MRGLLFSGGVDSTCLASMLRPERLLFIDYGQLPAKGELRACRSVADELGLQLQVVTVSLGALGAGTLAGRTSVADAVPEFWPFRNQMLVTVAAMATAGQGLTELIVGSVITDRRHPDGRPAFIEAMDGVLRSQASLSLSAPAADWTTEELVARSQVRPELLHWTFSCHTGEWACGRCSGCMKRAEAMETLSD